jgi:hypothetical protein
MICAILDARNSQALSPRDAAELVRALGVDPDVVTGSSPPHAADRQWVQELTKRLTVTPMFAGIQH